MLCSFRTGRSGSNWLDRLWSTKGFPAADNLDLGHFLSNPERSHSPAATAAGADASISLSASAPSQHLLPNHIQTPSTGDSTHKGEWYGVNVMSNVLSELFSMDDPNELPKFPGKKIPRKQTNPRICSAFLSNRFGEEGTGLPKDEITPEAASLGSDNNSAEVKEEYVDVAAEDKELFGYSRSEVTVIDTSCPDWKFDKLVFRRKNVWKVMDKKGKPRSFVGRKKRKWGSGCNENLGFVNRKVKVSNLELGLEKKVNGEGSLLPPNEGHNAHKEKRKQTCMGRPDDVTKGHKKRISFSGSPVISKKGESSVVVIEGIRTTKKRKFPNNCVKDAENTMP